jgi:DNA polymerase-3 subunit epsilon
LDEYPVTAFNMAFDFRFMRERGFKFTETKCLMHTSRKYISKRGAPSVEEVYEQFFPNEKYVEKHRGLDDAYHEAKILLKLVELKEQSDKNILK